MAEEPFMLVSLKEKQAATLSKVLNNPTATKILEYLTEKEATESEISKKLKIPLSTVHYNLQQLTEARLVVVEEFHYSKKGREVNHYKLANKYIIIAPKDADKSFLQHMKNFLPAILVTFGLAVILKVVQLFPRQVATAQTALDAAESAPVAEVAMARSADIAPLAVELAPKLPWWQSQAVDWLILGMLAVLFILILVEWLRRK